MYNMVTVVYSTLLYNQTESRTGSYQKTKTKASKYVR